MMRRTFLLLATILLAPVTQLPSAEKQPASRPDIVFIMADDLGNWKLIVSGEKEKQKIELFDLAADPSESENLAEQNPEKAEQLLGELEKMAARDRDSVVTN